MRIGQRRCWELRTPLFPERLSFGAHARLRKPFPGAHQNHRLGSTKCEMRKDTEFTDYYKQFRPAFVDRK